MRRILGIMLGLTCCYSAAYASSGSMRAAGGVSGWGASGPAPSRAFLGATGYDSPAVPNPFARIEDRGSRFDLEAFAYKISYIGGILLTADRVARSVNSVLDSASMVRDDGTCLRLNCEPDSRGFSVGLVMSRPLGF